MATLRDLAKTIRSKNAGVDHLTFDIIFDDRHLFEAVKASGIITPETICNLYGIPQERLSHFYVFEPAQAFKFSIRRLRPAGGPGESDVFGCQQCSTDRSSIWRFPCHRERMSRCCDHPDFEARGENAWQSNRPPTISYLRLPKPLVWI